MNHTRYFQNMSIFWPHPIMFYFSNNYVLIRAFTFPKRNEKDIDDLNLADITGFNTFDGVPILYRHCQLLIEQRYHIHIMLSYIIYILEKPNLQVII